MVSLETRLVGGDRGGRNYTISIGKKPQFSVAAVIERPFVEADGGGERNCVREVEGRIAGGGGS